MAMRHQRGFNLIEAAVVVSVLGIIIAAGLPSMADWIRSTHVRNIAETTQAGLQKARQEAMKRNRVVTFWLVSPPTTARPDNTCGLAADSAAWVVSLENPSGACGADPSATVAPRIVEAYGPGNGAEGITVAAVDAGGGAATSVSFNGFGQRTGNGLTQIDIAHASSTDVRPLRIQVSTSGGIRMCDPVVTAASPTDPRACQ